MCYKLLNTVFLLTAPHFQAMDEDDNQYEDAEEELQELEETEYEDDKHQQNSRPYPDPERVKEIGLSGARVSRQDMLRINVGFNQMLKVAKGNKVPSKNNPANILLSSGPDSRCKESLITKALKTVNHILEPNPPTMISANLVGPRLPKRTHTTQIDFP